MKAKSEYVSEMTQDVKTAIKGYAEKSSSFAKEHKRPLLAGAVVLGLAGAATAATNMGYGVIDLGGNILDTVNNSATYIVPGMVFDESTSHYVPTAANFPCPGDIYANLAQWADVHGKGIIGFNMNTREFLITGHPFSHWYTQWLQVPTKTSF